MVKGGDNYPALFLRLQISEIILCSASSREKASQPIISKSISIRRLLTTRLLSWSLGRFSTIITPLLLLMFKI